MSPLGVHSQNAWHLLLDPVPGIFWPTSLTDQMPIDSRRRLGAPIPWSCGSLRQDLGLRAGEVIGGGETRSPAYPEQSAPPRWVGNAHPIRPRELSRGKP